MSGTYQEINLDDLEGKAPPDDIEIINEETLAPEPEEETEPTEPASKKQEVEASDEEEEAESGRTGKRTRSQRLKAQRDAFAQRLAEAEARATAAEERARKFESTATDSTAVGMDLLITGIESDIKALRQDFNVAFDAGDREQLFDVQQKISEKVAEKKQAERERASLPTRRAPKDSGGDTPPQTKETPSAPPKRAPVGEPSEEAKSWYEKNKAWFNKDPVMTAVARAIDSAMVHEDGMTSDDPDYFDELDRRLRAEIPHKFKDKTPTAGSGKTGPTVQNRGSTPTANGKIRVTITQADREMARHLNISIEDYAREKAKRDRAQQTATQYTEI